MPIISVITINYNSSDYTIKLAKTLKEYTSTSLDYELIIVDNASSKEEKEKLKVLENQDKIKIVYSRLNTGFSAGNMMGVQHSNADYYFFLNNDTELRNDVLSIFYEYALQNQKSALISAQIFADENDTIDTSFTTFPSLSGSLFGSKVASLFKKHKFPSRKELLKEPRDVEVVRGSCMFANAKVFDELGGLETLFFLYCEEEDISKRVWDAGYHVTIVPQAKIIHFGGGSSEQKYALEKEFYLSYFLLIDKHFGFCSAKIMKCLTVFKLFRRSFRSPHYFKIFLFLLRGGPVKESLRYKQSII